jgi:hypothetical protein
MKTPLKTQCKMKNGKWKKSMQSVKWKMQSAK